MNKSNISPNVTVVGVQSPVMELEAATIEAQCLRHDIENDMEEARKLNPHLSWDDIMFDQHAKITELTIMEHQVAIMYLELCN